MTTEKCRLENGLKRLYTGMVSKDFGLMCFYFSVSDPDPHSAKMLDPDPDPHKTDADPKHWVNCFYIVIL
jgi:hypothetical protein